MRGASVDIVELARFSALAHGWWCKNPLLKTMNPARVQFISSHATVAQGSLLLDVGCGGGLLSEALGRVGYTVTGLDASQEMIQIAKQHAKMDPFLRVEYRHGSVEDWSPESMDIVTAMEVVEHVTEPRAFVKTLSGILKPGGTLFMSTINRSALAYLLTIVAAEHLLELVPRETHSWSKFIAPDELVEYARSAGLEVKEISGLVFNPLLFTWELAPSILECNYILACKKPGRV